MRAFFPCVRVFLAGGFLPQAFLMTLPTKGGISRHKATNMHKSCQPVNDKVNATRKITPAATGFKRYQANLSEFSCMYG